MTCPYFITENWRFRGSLLCKGRSIPRRDYLRISELHPLRKGSGLGSGIQLVTGARAT
jgi:hypothetical protein